MGITTSESSALSIFMPLIFEIQLINGALFLNARFVLLASLSSLRVISPSDISFDVLILIYLLTL